MKFEEAMESTRRAHETSDIEEFFPMGDDIITMIGVGQLGDLWLPTVRQIMKEDIPSALPENIEVKAGMGMANGKLAKLFTLTSDTDWAILTITEWHDSCDEFMRHFERAGFFLFEIITPKKHYKVMVVDGKVHEKAECPISPDVYEDYINGKYDHEGPMPTTREVGQA